MATNMTLLCIHCDPAPLSLLRANGYRVLTATSGHEGLQLFMTRQVDAIVLEYHMGFLDGGVVAAEIKKTRRPQIPILMVVDHLDVPEGALRSVDIVVDKFDGDHFLVSAVRSVLEAMPLSPDKTRKSSRRAASRRRSSSRIADLKPTACHSSVPFSSEEWQNIINGTVKFGSDA
jgi:CheY-like chemotaxis protein